VSLRDLQDPTSHLQLRSTCACFQNLISPRKQLLDILKFVSHMFAYVLIFEEQPLIGLYEEMTRVAATPTENTFPSCYFVC
jgi:hypothetical protein